MSDELTNALPTPAPTPRSNLPWQWPTPPGGKRHVPAPGVGMPQPCRVEMAVGTLLQGDMVGFDPLTRRIAIRALGSASEVSLPFVRIRRVTLTVPLPRLPRAGARRERVPVAAQERDYRLQQVGDAHAAPLTGRTAGHVEAAEGMYLFAPLGDEGAVQRVFVPRAAYSRCEFGASAEELAARHWIASPAQLREAVAQDQQQAVVPLGQALVELGLLTQPQLDHARATLDGTAALGETLVGAGLLSRTNLQTALARRMGFPLVDLERFPVDPEALALLPLPMAVSHRVLPLLRHQGGMIVAVDRPARLIKLRQQAGYEKMPMVPVLALKAQILLTLSRLSGEGWQHDPSEGESLFDASI